MEDTKRHIKVSFGHFPEEHRDIEDEPEPSVDMKNVHRFFDKSIPENKSYAQGHQTTHHKILPVERPC
jgi:hypothetical protein